MKLLYIVSNYLSKSNIKIAGWVTLGAVLLYLILWITTPKPQPSQDFKKQIDSLNLVTQQLIQKQKYYDSLKSAEEKKIREVDEKLKNIKEKTTIIKEYYYEKNKVINNYDLRQLDSFFSSRYGH